jgi:hypothetical protein
MRRSAQHSGRWIACRHRPVGVMPRHLIVDEVARTFRVDAQAAHPEVQICSRQSNGKMTELYAVNSGRSTLMSRGLKRQGR